MGGPNLRNVGELHGARAAVMVKCPVCKRERMFKSICLVMCNGVPGNRTIEALRFRCLSCGRGGLRAYRRPADMP